MPINKTLADRRAAGRGAPLPAVARAPRDVRIRAAGRGQRRRRRRRSPAAPAQGHPVEGEPHPLEPVPGAAIRAPVGRTHPHASRSGCAPPAWPSTSARRAATTSTRPAASSPRASSSRSAPARNDDRGRRAGPSTRAGHRRLRPHRRVLGIHAHHGARVRPALPVARPAAAGRDPVAPGHLGGQRVDDAGGARALGRGAQDLGARPAPRALPGRDRLLEDDLRRAQRARTARDQRGRRGGRPRRGRGARRRRGRRAAPPPRQTPSSSSSASCAWATSAATARPCSTCCWGS